jgi:hypothetical protein
MNTNVQMSIFSTYIQLYVSDSFQTTELNYTVDVVSDQTNVHFQIPCQEFIDVVGRSCGDIQILFDSSSWTVCTTSGSEKSVRVKQSVQSYQMIHPSSIVHLPASVFFKQAGSACISIGPINVRIEDYHLHISTKSEFIEFESTIPTPNIETCPGPDNFTFKYFYN